MPALDPRPFGDPFVRRVYDLFKVLIGHHFFGQIAARSHDVYTHNSSYLITHQMALRENYIEVLISLREKEPLNCHNLPAACGPAKPDISCAFPTIPC